MARREQALAEAIAGSEVFHYALPARGLAVPSREKEEQNEERDERCAVVVAGAVEAVGDRRANRRVVP